MYALMKKEKGLEMYWTGEYGKKGPAMSSVVERAKTFDTAASAYAFGGLSPAFSWFRVGNLMYVENDDGFKSRWWF